MSTDDSLFGGLDRSDLVSLARVLYPHDSIGDSAYVRTVASILSRASIDPRLFHVLRDGLVELRSAAGTELNAVPEGQQQELLSERVATPFFQTFRPLVAWYLYDDHEVWEAIGYPGASFEMGGYLHRGFDDLSWLPEPRIEEPDEPAPSIGPLPENAGVAR